MRLRKTKVERYRRMQRRYAKRHCYFWLPCPLCGVEFGGHEPSGSIITGPSGEGRAICPHCTAERQWAAEAQLRKLGHSFELSTTRWGFNGMYTHRIPSVSPYPPGLDRSQTSAPDDVGREDTA